MTEDQRPRPHRPGRATDRRAAVVSPEAGPEVVEALRVVLQHAIASPFALVAEESMWVGFHLTEILAPLQRLRPHSLPLTVRQQMLTGDTGRALEVLERSAPQPTGTVDPEVVSADINDWAAVLMQMVTRCYTLRPMTESAMHGRIVGLLRELGVGHPQNPRGARYLPSDVRHRLAH